MLGLPNTVRACLFDLDGVLTDTASVHRTAWKAMFDSYLRDRAKKTGEPFVPFDVAADYHAFAMKQITEQKQLVEDLGLKQQ